MENKETWAGKKISQPEPQRRPPIRYATTPQEILSASYVIPKEDAPVLLERAMKELFPDQDIDFQESIALSIQVLEKINQYMGRK